MQTYRNYLPVLTAFIGSLMLSLIAIYYDPILARDSALYVDIARSFTAQGFASATDRFDWPWLSFMIALIHKGSSLTLIVSGHLLMGVLMAGTAALLTRATQLLKPAAAWWGCLVSLSLPAYNGYRDAILREPGFWMFTALSLVAVSLWSKQTQRSWPYLLMAILSIFAAMSFRLEAAFLFGALILTVGARYTASLELKHGRKSYILLLFLLLLLMSVAVYLITFVRPESTRILSYMQLLNPNTIVAQLDTSATLLADHVLAKYSSDDAKLILLFGFLGIILLTSVKLLGPFVIPLTLSSRGLLNRPLDSTAIFMLSGVGLYFLVLITFFIQKNFMIDRYTAQLHILTTPLIALSAWNFKQRFTIAGKILAVFSILLALSNVVSISEKRTHYLPAGDWIDRNLSTHRLTYFSDGRISFYAGRDYIVPYISEEQALGAQFKNYDYFVLESSQASPLLKQRLEAGQLELLAEFSNGERHQLIILGKPVVGEN
jgi:hypothetical protein